jgi:hypothetical protein
VQTESLATGLDELSQSVTIAVNDIRTLLQRRHEVIERVHASWSGSWAGWHADQYYRDFEQPASSEMFDIEWGGGFGLRPMPTGWAQRSQADVTELVMELAPGPDSAAIEAQLDALVRIARDLQGDLVAELTPIRELEGYANERELLASIEETSWGISAGEYLRSRQPSSFASRDSRAIYQGLRVPPHLAVDADIVSALTKIDAVETFSRTARRLVRQIQIKTQMHTITPGTAYGLREIQLVCERFHDVVRQLRGRHDDRTTLEVTDEYDVQDFLHALLRVFFTDIRPEEWTPSYAGQSSRVDFLLKPEQILVEVKKRERHFEPKRWVISSFSMSHVTKTTQTARR